MPPDQSSTQAEVDNPPATSEAADAYRPKPGTAYRVNSSRASFAELWRDTRSPVVLIAWASKLLRIKLPGSVNDPQVVSLRPFIVPDDKTESVIPAEVRQKLAPVIRELNELGFGEPTFFYINDTFQQSEIVQAAMSHQSGQAVARVTHRREGDQLKKVHFFTEFFTGLTDDTFLYSSTALAQLNTPAQCRLNWRPRETTSQLWISHRKQIEAVVNENVKAVKCAECEQKVNLLERHHEAVRDFHLERGVFASMQGDDLAQVEAIDRNVEKKRFGEVRHPEVLAQLERLQNKRANLANGIMVLIVSIALFVVLGVGAWKQPWQVLLMIVVILLVHEAGHYLAMRMFHYRNVQMFFIPLFGAAVSGHNYTAPGWKKVIVALMGPLPGILLGSVLAVAGVARDNDTLINVAIMTIALNGLQLLPVLPLDGGRVMHALLFSRHYYLDTVFVVAAASLLVIAGGAIGDRILTGLGIVMFISVPMTYKVAKIAQEMRQQETKAKVVARPVASTLEAGVQGGEIAPRSESGAVTVHPELGQPGAANVEVAGIRDIAANRVAGDGMIPTPIAEEIIDKIRKKFPRIRSNKQVAQLTMRAYETLVSRPPGIAASIGFGVLHVGSIATALLMIAVIVAARNPNFMSMLQAHAYEPKHSVAPGEINIWETPPDGIASTNVAAIESADGVTTAGVQETLVATFSTSNEARQAFDQVLERIKSDDSESGRLVLFGQSILLSRPDSSNLVKWFDTFEEQTDDVFITGAESYLPLVLKCKASDGVEAASIVEQLRVYFGVSESLGLIPPWAGDEIDLRSTSERQRHEAARAVVQQLKMIDVFESPELETLRGEINRAAKRNQQDKIEALSTKLTDLQNAILLRELRRVREEEVAPEHRTLADVFIDIKEQELKLYDQLDVDTTEAYEAWSKQLEKLNTHKRDTIGPMLGQWPIESTDLNLSSNVRRNDHLYGYAVDAGGGALVVTVGFVDLSIGAPALLKWLQQRGCSEFQYDLNGPDAGGYEWDD